MNVLLGIGGGLATLLCVYLFVAMLKPEWF